jgi:catechol 2,3-dioxygenase-like lactoylglutathione lyase family enzyme
MKRFHVHVAVDDLAANIRFYSAMFGAQPAVVKDDYAKWMLEDPRINFAISNRGLGQGVDHLGLQVDSDEELAALREQVANADIAAREQPAAACCYARSNKYWVTDPQGMAWETYHTLADIPTFGADRASRATTVDTGSAVASACGTTAAAKGGCGSAAAATDAKPRAACC